MILNMYFKLDGKEKNRKKPILAEMPGWAWILSRGIDAGVF